MPSPAGPNASDISIQETLAILDGPFASLSTAVAQGGYAFWLGSGISRARVDDLKHVITRVLTHLRDRIDPSDPECPFSRAIVEALEWAALSKTDRDSIDFSVPVVDWPVLATVLGNLTNRYAELLDVRVTGRSEDYLLWEGVNVVTTFALAVADPDCEHLCIAILALEGVLPAVATANWDGLIEAAVDQLTGSGSMLQVCVAKEDFRNLSARSQLLKFHGCAVLAGRNEAAYRHLLIARASQIIGWPHNDDYEEMRARLVSLATNRPTLMIGLSAQDSNIQHVFAEARKRLSWPCTSDPPAHVFAEDALGQHQRQLLKSAYGGSDYAANGTAIETRALLRAYAKPLLTGLVLLVLCHKLCRFAAIADAPHFTTNDHNELATGIRALRDRVASGADGDRLVFIRSLIQFATRWLALFQEGVVFTAVTQHYRALGSLPTHLIETDPTLPTSGVRELAAALGILGLGLVSASWTIGAGDCGSLTAAPLRVTSVMGTMRVFFVANSRAAARLESEGVIQSTDSDAIIVHSASPVRMTKRSPRSILGRTGRAGAREVDMTTLLHESPNAAELQLRFRQEAVL